MATTRDDNNWHLDKKVPITLIGVLAAQLASGVWFASKLDARIAALESARIDQHERDERQDKQVAEALALVRAQLDRMDGKLDRLVEKRP